VDDLVLRGKNEALRAFQPLRSTEFDDPATRSYLDGVAKLEANDPGALAALAPTSARTPRPAGELSPKTLLEPRHREPASP
jgi:adenylate cyclase